MPRASAQRPMGVDDGYARAGGSTLALEQAIELLRTHPEEKFTRGKIAERLDVFRRFGDTEDRRNKLQKRLKNHPDVYCHPPPPGKRDGSFQNKGTRGRGSPRADTYTVVRLTRYITQN